MKFTKMQGCGNDYVYANCMSAPLENPAGTAVQVSNRHFGIGADGLILICPSERADFRMEMYNADGSVGAMCGNGIRCVGKYVYDQGLTDRTHLTVETGDGVKQLDLHVEDGAVTSVRVDMGEPRLSAASLPVIGLGEEVIARPIFMMSREWIMTCVCMGNPHAVIWVEDVDEVPLEQVGPNFEHACVFPDRVNVEFVHVINERELEMRVWERGSGETMACGTGASASVVASHLCGLTGRQVTVHLRGGDLQIELGEDGHVYLTGPAVTVFEGEMDVCRSC